ncbi:hypothetical protein BJK06_11205 [Curtobacterium sp. BH-2-1-1]|uniref:hypothetical protein n=1 Tax=Curtobacterium sp. BH-2-1-1 TaxID=1905847 RepID=UPI00089DD877|nr:hypothetical protein [Curtobacterium sp. BH-2-1-1]AOX66247.1 hypothetical protein BJK06_11205 [Curtobacterium sp. BH-2-1-1]
MDDILSLINKLPGVEEAWEERRFTVYRKRRALSVTVSDQGPVGGSHRYSATAEANDDPTAVSHGNAEATIEDALDAVHWWEFD